MNLSGIYSGAVLIVFLFYKRGPYFNDFSRFKKNKSMRIKAYLVLIGFILTGPLSAQNWTNYSVENTNSTMSENYFIGADLGADGKQWYCTTRGAEVYNGNEWVSYNIENSGLPDNYINEVKSGPNGKLWFATKAGVASFDGTNWTVYNVENSDLSNNNVRGLTFDSKGVLWVATYYGGLCKFDGSEWTIFNQDNSGIASNKILNIRIDSTDGIWMGTSKGVVILKDTVWTNYGAADHIFRNNYVYALNFAPNGDLWFSTGTEIVRKSGESWETFTPGNSNISEDSGNSIEFDKAGNVWVATYNFGVSKYDGTTWEVYNSQNSGLTGDKIRSVIIDSVSETIYFGVFGEGVVRLDSAGRWMDLTSLGGLASNSVKDIVFDRNNNGWIATSAGVSMFDGTHWQTWHEGNSALRDSKFTAVGIDGNGEVWCGSLYGKVARFDGVKWVNLEEPYFSTINSFALDSTGNFWIGSNGGVAQLSDTGYTTYNRLNSGLHSNVVVDIAIDKQNRKWFSTPKYSPSSPISSIIEGAVSMLDGDTWTIYAENTWRGLLRYEQTAIAIDLNDEMWFGNRSYGLVHYDNKETLTRYNYGSNGCSLSSSYITNIAVDQGNYKWIGTTRGLNRYKDDVWAEDDLFNNELLSSSITTIEVDRENNVWVGTNEGIFMYEQEPLVITKTEEKEYLTDQFLNNIVFLGGDFQINVADEFNGDIALVDAMGRIVASTFVQLSKGSNTVDLGVYNLLGGNYFMVVSNARNRFVSRVVVGL